MDRALRAAVEFEWDAKMEQLEQALDFSMAQIHLLQSKIAELQAEKEGLLQGIARLRVENERLLQETLEVSSLSSASEPPELTDSWENIRG